VSPPPGSESWRPRQLHPRPERKFVPFNIIHLISRDSSHSVCLVVLCCVGGKSAILTGVIIGLGGKTATTSRGNSLKDLIKTGESQAVVRVFLRNRGIDAFMHVRDCMSVIICIYGYA
jgi:hypothetical protein